MKIIRNWNVSCHVNLSNVGFLNVNKAVAVSIDNHKKKAEIDNHNISHSQRAWVAMQHRFILFAGAGFQGGYAVAHVGTPIPFMTWDAMIASVPGGVHGIIDCDMVSAAKKTCYKEGIILYLQHKSMCCMQERRDAEQRVGALGWRHLPLELQGVIDYEDVMDELGETHISNDNEVQVLQAYLDKVNSEHSEKLLCLGDWKHRRLAQCKELEMDVKACAEKVRVARVALSRARQAVKRRKSRQWRATLDAMSARQRKVVEKSDYTSIPVEAFVYPWRCNSIEINY
eukprot:3940721-Rhodomonas_salina.3